jgi:GT2 family glycosyltransferase
VKTAGGCIAVRSEIVRKIGCYDERLYVNEDTDFSFRVSLVTNIMALSMPIGIHHTKENGNRNWVFFKRGYILNQGMIARKHIGKSGFLKNWIQTRKGFAFGFVMIHIVFCMILLWANDIISFPILTSFVAALIIAETIYSKQKKQKVLSTLVVHYLSPYAVVAGFILEPYIRCNKNNCNR